MAIANLRVPISALPSAAGSQSWLGALNTSIGGALDKASEDKALSRLGDATVTGQLAPNQGFLSKLFGGGQQQASAPTAAAIPAPGAQAEVAASSPSPFSGDKQAFISSILPAAIEEGKRTGVDPRIIVAQAGVESGWGKHAPGNNLFGIKSHGQAGGNTLATTEYVNGQPQTETASFRGYASPTESVKGYGDFILQNPRYQGMRQAQGLEAQVAALGASGYATDPNYASKVGFIAKGIQLPQDQPANATQAIEAQTSGSGSVDPAVTTAYQQPNAQPQTAQPPIQDGNAPMPTAAAPQQVAQAGPQTLAAGVTPVAKGSINPTLIQQMLKDPQLNKIGLQLWQQNATGKTSDGWDFITLPDGTLARANKQTGAIESVGQFQKPSAPVSVGEGSSLVDPQTGKVVYQGAPKTPASYQEFQLAQQNGFTGSYADWEKVKVPGGVTVNNVPGENSTAKSAGEGLGKIFSTIFDGGQAAKQDKAQIGMLRSSLAQSPTGVLGALASTASDYGINVGPNADQVQVAKAVIAKMVPAQRVPGAGTTSDRDLAQFQAALPRLSGTTAGNATILDTLDALADFKSAQADIVTRFYAGELDQKGAVKELQNLPDPYSAYKKFVGSGEQPAAATTIKAAPSVGTVEQGYRFKGGDPKLQENWEPTR